MRQRLFWIAAAAGILSTLVLAASAGASPATTFTMHVNSLSGQLGSPSGPATNNSTCPGPVLNDFTSIDATGNGVTHVTVNGANDFWFTSTFTGTATVTYYPSGAVDSMGNVTSVSGTPDLQVTGHLTEWFGFEGNSMNAVAHGTIDFRGTVVGSGAPISFHDDAHLAWLPSVDQNGPPSFFFNKANC